MGRGGPCGISVVRQLNYTREKKHAFGPPKTETSTRTIPIDGELVAILRRWKARQAENEMRRGKAYFYTYEAKDGCLWQMHKQTEPPEGLTRRPLVCTQENGKAIPHDTLRRELNRFGVNSLRHTHATICAENGAPPKGLAGRLGHKNIAITENLYTHETKRMQRETIAAFESRSAGSRRRPSRY